MSNIEKKKRTDLDKPHTPEERAMSFFDLDGIGAAEIESDFDQQEFVVGIIADVRNDDPKVRLRAREFLWKMKKDAAILSGKVGESHATREGEDQQGRRIKESISTRGLLRRMTGANPHERDSSNDDSTNNVKRARRGEEEAITSESLLGFNQQPVGRRDLGGEGGEGATGPADNGRAGMVQGGHLGPVEGVEAGDGGRTGSVEARVPQAGDGTGEGRGAISEGE